MKIGIPREVKNNENRVGLPPNGVSALADNSHDVYVETDAGIGSQFTDEDYKMRAQRSLIALKKHGMSSWSSRSKSLKLKNINISEKI